MTTPQPPPRWRTAAFDLLLLTVAGLGFSAGTLAHRTLRDPLVLAVLALWIAAWAAITALCRPRCADRAEPPAGPVDVIDVIESWRSH